MKSNMRYDVQAAQKCEKPGAGMIRAAGIVMAMTLLSRVVGMLRDSVNNGQMGVGPESDAYRLAFRIPDLLMYLIAGGALASTFVPVFSEYLLKKNVTGAWRTFSIVATVTFVVAVAFVLVGEIWTPAFVRLVCHLHPPDARFDLTVRLVRIVLPAQIFFLLGGLLMGVQNAHGKFLIPALGPTIYNLGIICGALFLYHTGLGAAGIMWGALLGAFVGNFGMQLLQVTKLGMQFRPNLDIWDTGARRVWQLLLPIVLGVSLPNVDQLINGYFSAVLPIGSVSNMDNAYRLMLIPIGIFAQAMSIAIFPTMSTYAAAGQRKELRQTINKGLRSIVFLTAPSSALLFLLGVPIISILYQHHKFHASDTLNTMIPLHLLSLGIVAWSAQALLTRAFYSIRDSRTPVICGTVMTVLFITMSWFVVTFHPKDWGLAGLAMATTVAASMHTAVLYLALRRQLQGLLGRKMLLSVLSTFLSTATLCLVTILLQSTIQRYFEPLHSTLNALIVLLVAGSGGAFSFYVVAKALKMPEVATVHALVGRLATR